MENFNEIINSFKDKQVYINGVKGKLIDISADYIKLLVISGEKENKTREEVFIPITQIYSVSEGQKKGLENFKGD